MHMQVVRLLGVCTREQPLTIIIEFMANGSLKDYLEENKPSPDGLVELLAHELAQMCRDIASGMAFLSSHNFVHRDVAARYVEQT
jgi:serine/threonine protein kinase